MFLALCWLNEARCQQTFSEHVETLAWRTNLFPDYHLPPNRLWRATCSQKQNGQHFQVHQVRLFCLQFFRIFRQFYASVTFQDDEKTRHAVLHGWRWHQRVYGCIPVKRTVKNSDHNGQLSRKTKIFKRLFRWPQMAQTYSTTNLWVCACDSRQCCFQLRALWRSKENWLQETWTSVHQLLSVFWMVPH